MTKMEIFFFTMCGSEKYCYNFSFYCGKESGAGKGTALGTHDETDREH